MKSHKINKVFVELDCGEVFKSKENSLPGNWKDINNITQQEWISLICKLRYDIEDLSTENYTLKREIYCLREGIIEKK